QSTLSNGSPSLAFVVTVMGCVTVEVIVAHPGAKTTIPRIEKKYTHLKWQYIVPFLLVMVIY
ncbi:MAG: hypothetical protein OEM31_07965, partial [Gammaproteobacteria bacterium]|nr:hypothetical protein [Gammaproteobacteria bacterium]